MAKAKWNSSIDNGLKFEWGYHDFKGFYILDIWKMNNLLKSAKIVEWLWILTFATIFRRATNDGSLISNQVLLSNSIHSYVQFVIFFGKKSIVINMKQLLLNRDIIFYVCSTLNANKFSFQNTSSHRDRCGCTLQVLGSYYRQLFQTS